MEESKLFKIKELKRREDFPYWFYQLKTAFEALGLDDITFGKNAVIEIDPLDTEEIKREKERKNAAWKRSDAKARSIIIASLHQSFVLHIMNCDTAKKMYERLLVLFDKRDSLGKDELVQRFFGLRLENGMSIVDFVSHIEYMVHQMKDYGIDIGDEMIMNKIIMSLPIDYRSFRSAWESVPVEFRNMNELSKRLFMEEARIREVVPMECEAFTTSTNMQKRNSNNFERREAIGKNLRNDERFNRNDGRFNGRFNRFERKFENFDGVCFNCNKRGHRSSECRIGKLCFSCGKPGHIQSRCRQRDNFQNKSNTNEVVKKNTEKSAFGSMDVSNFYGKEDWICDSGSTDHLTMQKHWLCNYVDFATPKDIKIGDGSVIKAYGCGNIKIWSFDGDEWIEKEITGVLFVPNICTNLFSQGKVLDHGYKLYSNSEKLEILDNNKVVAVGVRENGLFKMKFKFRNPVVLSAIKRKLTLEEWHRKLGHQNKKHVIEQLLKNDVDFINEDFKCDDCFVGKANREPFKSSRNNTNTCGEIVHADTSGPMKTLSLGNSRYFLLIKDDYSHFRRIFFMKGKNEVYNFLREFILWSEKQCGCRIKIFRSDSGCEFTNKLVGKLLLDYGIVHQRSVPYTPEQNGSIERDMRTVVEMARTMIHAQNLNVNFWAEALNYSIYILNRTGTSSIVGKTPYELWYDRQIHFNFYHEFGARVLTYIPKHMRLKFDKKAKQMFFVGIPENTKGYRVYDNDTSKITIVRNITSSSIQATERVVPVEENHENISCNEYLQEERMDWQDTTCMMSTIDENVPKNYIEAMNSENSENWQIAMKEEINSLLENETWVLVEKPMEKKILDNKWCYTIKRNSDDSIERFKARLVTRGFRQKLGEDYTETYSPVVKYTSVRLLFAYAAMRKMIIKQFDVKTAFLYGNLQEDVYMDQPQGFADGTGRICKLMRSLYGLKQSPRCWNERFRNFVSKFGFTAVVSDPCVFISRRNNTMIILAIYVDDGLIFAQNQADIEIMMGELQKEFQIHTIENNCYLSIEYRMNKDFSIFINQKSFIKKIISRFNMDSCETVSTPIDHNQILDEANDTQISQFPYRQLIGSLLFLSVVSRPDITYTVAVLSRYLERPKQIHVNAAKRVIKFLKGTMNQGIRYSAKEMEIYGYSDADYAGDVNTRRSTSGYVFIFAGGAISWGSELQRSVSLSTTESEFIAAAQATKELVWLKYFMEEITNTKNFVMHLLVDNQSAIRLIKNSELHKRSKHIEVRHLFVREKYQEGFFKLNYVPTREQLADIFTKGLTKVVFDGLSKGIGMVSEEMEKFANMMVRCDRMNYVRKKTMNVLVEGNIGSGKSTFLKFFAEDDDICVITEPIYKWQNLRGLNILEQMYKDPNKWAFPFQSYVTLTMLQAHLIETNRHIKIMERSLLSARNVFIKALNKNGVLTTGMYFVLEEWFEFIEANINIQVDLIIYLRCSPKTSFERLKKRGRSEEESIDFTYVKQIHDLHEQWLTGKNSSLPVLIVDGELQQEQILQECNNIKKEILERFFK